MPTPGKSVTIDESKNVQREIPATPSDANADAGTPPGEPVLLNVYDLLPQSDWTDLAWYWGLSVHHSAVQAYGTEFSFGGHELSCSGVFESPPRRAEGAVWRETLCMGYTQLGEQDLRSLMRSVGENEWPGNGYHLTKRNCNHFSDELCQRLVGGRAPSYVNRLAFLGSQPLIERMLPLAITEGQPTAVPVGPAAAGAADFRTPTEEELQGVEEQLKRAGYGDVPRAEVLRLLETQQRIQQQNAAR